MEMKKKLIEVAIPLEAINAESAREKTIRHGHPSTLHMWWARRPLATARAVLWSSLVDDPSSHPESFPSEEEQDSERHRLFEILSKLVKPEYANDTAVISAAKEEIEKSVGRSPISSLDPFAGGGAIPLEAQRLGLEAYAGDLNPVAVMINKAMIEIPYRFANTRPVNPNWASQITGRQKYTIRGLAGMAEDIQYYGVWIKKQAYKRIGGLYPKAKLQDGSEATVISWIWARTVRCPNPACGCIIPMVSNPILSKKKGNYVWMEPQVSGNNVIFNIRSGISQPKLPNNKKGRGAAFICPACGQTTLDEYVKQEGKKGTIGVQLIAIAAEGKHGRVYLPANQEHIEAANVKLPDSYPDGAMPTNPRWFSPPAFGMENYSQLFTPRQLTALTTFCDLIDEVGKKVESDAIEAGMSNDGIGLAENGAGAKAYGEAIGVNLAFVISKMADLGNSLCAWEPIAQCPRHMYSRQAIPMVWDFAEANIFSTSSGSWDVFLRNQMHSYTSGLFDFDRRLPGHAEQMDAQTDNGMRNIVVSTDPPYYDNIGYADLSDFFYVWLRRSLRRIYPGIFRTMLVPKEEELIATPHRHGGDSNKAKEFFEHGMYDTCCQIYKYAAEDIPVTIYYAFKQSDTDSENNTASSGWETMLSAIVKAGFAITGTWPMRTEMSSRSIAQGTNALASSIILVCRKRSADARSVTRREFINALHREMRPALEKLQSANIAPVDLAQSAIGPGIGVFSRFKSVLEADGKPMSVRSALQIINQELDAFYNEQEGELDRESRFCVDLFNQYAFNTLKFGDADILSRAKNTSVQALADRGVLYAAKGQVRLLTREELPEQVKSGEECIWLLTQQLARAMEKDGIKGCASIVMNMFGSNAENATALAYRLYTICERKNWPQEGFAYNNLVVAWPEIQTMAADMQASKPVQMSLADIMQSNDQ